MKKNTITIALALTTTTTFATDLQPNGARFAAQGSTMVSAAKDSFAVMVNPANLLTHSDSEWVGEAALNFIQRDSSSAVEQDPINMLGGFVAKGNLMAGLVYSGTAGSESAPYDPANQLGLETSQSAIAIAYGNELKEGDVFTYGAGVVLNIIDLKPSQSPAFFGSGYTASLKAGLNQDISLAQQAILFSVDFGAAYSNEIEPDDVKQPEFTLRPEIIRYGITTHITHLNSSLSWDLALTAERVSITQTKDTIFPIYSAGSETRLGSELLLINPMSLSGDFALRAGMRYFDEEQTRELFSGGLGWTSGSWSLDFSAAEDAFTENAMIYNASVTYLF
ncbi:hypothetical protein OPS25_13845 [Alteromonas ponticola]|uniref:Outer membrane protein transport protein (OMPP1/FadL/TodX) n=1 Tax=Alteromonas aquimaris TaxID=2998417 RepID=A0ABT3P9X7_9ALTE|nr:hypothetical protein [Alteromonas aquimaris]MCW8109587.1 hypothetical protein [Alteromonas aquimaris]